ncbi:MAG: hypothetical protein NVS3B10_29080 [Polyangiales bacterium]
MLSIAMVDAPFAMSGATVTAVNLGIDKVEVVGAGAPTVVATYATPDVVNILSYTSAKAALSFPAATIPAGSYHQVRFVLDSATTTIAYTDSKGVAHTAPLTVPSGTTGGFGNASSTDAGDGSGTSGFKVNVALDAVANATYGFILDFNAAQSIVAAGPNFILKPVVVASAVATSGALAGTVTSSAGASVVGAEVDARQNGVTINSGLTGTDGTFAINALPIGTYSLVVLNSGTTSSGATFAATGFDATVGVSLAVPTSATVAAGATTNVGAIKD